MTKDIRTMIINRIVERIPSFLKPVDYLSDALDIGKESAYRRLRGNMSFSIEELVILSKDLGFSVDELVGLKTDSEKIVIDLNNKDNPMDAFFGKMKKYRKEVDARLNDTNSSTIMAVNYLPAILCIHNKELFKFSYYAWLHRRSNGIVKLRYSDVVIPPELESLRYNLDIDAGKVKDNTFIIDSNVFLSPLKKVSYFYKLKLISDDELIIVKDAFREMIDYLEEVVRTGGVDQDTKSYFYLSDINIDVNSSYSKVGGETTSSFNFYFFNRIVIHNSELCETHKEWLISLKKYSTLITESNEALQAEYFGKQREYIDQA